MLYPEPLQSFVKATALHELLHNQREEWAVTQTFQVETGLWRWNVFYLSAYRETVETGSFFLLNEFSCVSQVLFQGATNRNKSLPSSTKKEVLQHEMHICLFDKKGEKNCKHCYRVRSRSAYVLRVFFLMILSNVAF